MMRSGGAAGAQGPRIWLRPAASDIPTPDALLRAFAALRPQPVLLDQPPQGGLPLWLDTARPDLVLSLTHLPPPALIEAALLRNLPLVLADADVSGWPRPPFWRRHTERRMLTRMARILVPDGAARDEAVRRGAHPARLIVTGALTETRAPLRCSEADRSAIARALGGRQSWLAAAIPPAEEEAVIAAHHAALGHSHRALLLIQPADPRRAPALTEALEAEGIHAALRSDVDEPARDHQALVLDDPGELGLWYRLASVTLMGGTLSGDDAAARHPFEAAALGSAMLHGPHTGRHPDVWRQLERAGATRLVQRPTGLAEMLSALMAPDAAALLAGRAWNVSTGGAAVAKRIAEATIAVLDPEAERQH